MEWLLLSVIFQDDKNDSSIAFHSVVACCWWLAWCLFPVLHSEQCFHNYCYCRQWICSWAKQDTKRFYYHRHHFFAQLMEGHPSYHPPQLHLMPTQDFIQSSKLLQFRWSEAKIESRLESVLKSVGENSTLTFDPAHNYYSLRATGIWGGRFWIPVHEKKKKKKKKKWEWCSKKRTRDTTTMPMVSVPHLSQAVRWTQLPCDARRASQQQIAIF